MKRIYTHIETKQVYLINERAHKIYARNIGPTKLLETYKIEEFATDEDTEIEYGKRLAAFYGSM